MALPKWTDERTQSLVDFVGEGPVSQVVVAQAAEELETSSRSVSSKSFSDEQEATLNNFVVDNSGVYTYAEIAQNFEGGAFSAKSIQGKILSMELTEHVKPAPKPESVRTYTPQEEEQFVSMVQGGSFVEEIAEALGKSVNSIRGKALSLLRSGDINAIPKQKETKGSSKADVLADLDISGMSVEDIANEIGKTVRGVKTMLTRRGLQCADYNGAAKKEIG
jgi:DNA-binding NarL/FixJ family response regulator